ncbi:MAG: hypothetical protein QMD06_04580 [Candidatus Altarchaeum sp.]|nr:hypothetical protein [Candidatus Altarchaeum sp.]
MRGKQKRAIARNIIWAGVVIAENSSKLFDLVRNMTDKKISKVLLW